MKALIRDRDVLASVRPLELTAYLRAGGWSAAETRPGAFAQWLRKDEAGEEYEVVVPLDRNVRDYAARIADALGVLEAVERRAQTEIVRDRGPLGRDAFHRRGRASPAGNHRS